MRGFFGRKMTMVAALLATTGMASAEDVEVLHWWTSGGEAAALNVLKEDVAAKGTGWTDMQRHIFEEECWKADAPMIAMGALSLVGPVIYPRWIPSVSDLWQSTYALHEILGYWVYRYRGWL